MPPLQFQRELAAMTLLSQHRNVLPLLGACMQPESGRAGHAVLRQVKPPALPTLPSVHQFWHLRRCPKQCHGWGHNRHRSLQSAGLPGSLRGWMPTRTAGRAGGHCMGCCTRPPWRSHGRRWPPCAAELPGACCTCTRTASSTATSNQVFFGLRA